MLMSILFWGVVCLVVIALLAKIPGIDLALKPFALLMQDLIKWFGATFGGYLVYLVKSFIAAHLTVIKHLMYSEETFDVELRVRKESEGT